MLILIGADGDNPDSKVAKRFGHANYFILYNTDTKSFTVDENNAEEHNHDVMYDYLDKGVKAFIVGNIGPYAFEIVNTPESKVYLARKMSVSESISKFLNEELEHLTGPTVKKSIDHDHKTGRHQGGKRHSHSGRRHHGFNE